MTTVGLSLDQIASLLQPYLPLTSDGRERVPGKQLYERVSAYVDLLLRWNARTNLTAIRSPEEMVTRHFGESFFAGRQLSSHTGSLLDLGSGGGFPGLPIQLLYPVLRVTLAESQHRKVAFLREVIRALDLNTEVWPRRSEEFSPETRFNVVSLRAVDRMKAAVQQAAVLADSAVLLLGSESSEADPSMMPAGFTEERVVAIPNSERKVVRVYRKTAGTFHVEHTLQLARTFLKG